MAVPVWSLSINLETKTATFQSGLSDAAKSARASFSEIKQNADSMGRSVGGSMGEARHGVMLLGEEFGVHLPRGLTTFIASLGPVGAAMEAAFPFLAIIVGATLLLKHLSKLKEEGEALTQSQVQFGTTVTNVLNGLDDKLLQAGIRTDELNHNHLGALEKQLQLIDHQSFNELSRSFEVIAKSADVTFADLKASFTDTFFQVSKGADGAKHALAEFKSSYDSLLAQHKDKEANDLLAGTLESAKKSYELMQAQQGGHGSDEKELAAQEKLIAVLQSQVEVREKVNALKDAEGGNARQTEQNKTTDDGDKVAREQAQIQKRAMEEAQKLWEENYREAVARLQENERERIDATKQGSSARLAAIDAAIKEEESKGLQDTNFYRGLLTSRVDVTRQMAEEQDKLQAEAGKQEAEHGLKMGQLQVAAQRDAAQLSLAALRMSAGQLAAMKINSAQQEYQNQLHANEQEQAALDKNGKDYENKLKALQNRQLELTKEFENEKARITQQSEQHKAQQVIDAENRMGAAIASTAARSIVAGKNMAQAFAHLGSEMLQSSLTNLLQMETVQGRKRFGDARTAAADAYEWAGNPILGAIAGAAAFASVMAFETGGIVPGVEKGDSVHAMLTPGEAVLPKRLTENLTHAARSASGDSPAIHVHHSPTYHIQTIDGDGVRGMLDKHADEFKKSFHNHVRRMNH